MVSDSIANASINAAPNAKDFPKKKRANRSAKLKQCKLDARREQWLSHVKNKGSKEDWKLENRQRSGSDGFLENIETRRRIDEENDGSMHQGSDSESPLDSPTGLTGILTGNHSSTNCTASSSSNSSRGSSIGCCSGSTTEEEEEEEEGDDGCLDDWEAVADALAADEKPQNSPSDPPLEQEAVGGLHSQEEQVNISASSPESVGLEGMKRPPRTAPHNNQAAVADALAADEKPQNSPSDPPLEQEAVGGLHSQEEQVNISASSPESVGLEGMKRPPRTAPHNNQAWRPDDAFRPQSLPNLFKQYSFPDGSRNYGSRGIPWGCSSVLSVPSSCPICFEDLDKTDSSFLPCPCGFRLCLFCHKRILEEDGRCPACRKPYEHDCVEAEPSLHGGNLTLRLTRSHSMITGT